MPASEIGQRPKVTTKVFDFGNGPPPSAGASSSRPPTPKKLLSPLVPASARPRAKVSATATITPRNFSTSSVGGPPRAPPLAPSRSTSPFKPRSVIGSASPPSMTTAKPRVVVRSPPTITTARPGTSSTRTSPELKPRAPATPRLNDQTPLGRGRTDSITLKHAPSLSSLGVRTPVSRQSPLPGGSPAPNPSGLVPAPLRITSKVSGGAKKALHSPSASFSVPSSPAAHEHVARPAPGSLRIHAPSAIKRPSLSLDSPTSGFSPLSQSPSLPIFSFPDATSSPNLARVPLPRRPSSPGVQRGFFVPSSSDDSSLTLNESVVSKTRGPISAKVDPALIPLPLASPPISSLSLSSRSSASSWTAESHGAQDTSSATSYFAPGTGSAPLKPFTHQSRPPGGNTNGLFIKLDNDDNKDDTPGATPEASAIMGSRHEAKSNRKIADLEISNRSLLAINTTLEATKHRQAKELRELRRRLRESRLSLPPAAYKALQAQEGPALEEIEDDSDDSDPEEEEEKEDQGAKGEADAAYWRVRGLLDGLLETGRRALEVKPVDLVPAEGSKGAAKVLSAEEVRSWHRDSAIEREDLANLSIISEGLSNGDEEAGDASFALRDELSLDTTGSLSDEEEENVSFVLPTFDDIPSRPPIIVSGH